MTTDNTEPKQEDEQRVVAPVQPVVMGPHIKDVTDPNELRVVCIELWKLLDNIDTLDDACKDDNARFRDLVRDQQQKRFKYIVSDGHELYRA